jgi:hypothetical protein
LLSRFGTAAEEVTSIAALVGSSSPVIAIIVDIIGVFHAITVGLVIVL